MNEIINLGNGAWVKVTMLKGEAGNDIQSIELTNTSGLVDTYTITLTDGHTHTFEVTNGRSIVSVTKTSSVGLVDTYTILFNDNTTITFDVGLANVTVDSAMSPTSENPVMNKVLVNYINNHLSHVGQIVMTTTLDTEAKVIAQYGGVHWSKIEDKMLIGASSTYAVSSTGGALEHNHDYSVAYNSYNSQVCGDTSSGLTVVDYSMGYPRYPLPEELPTSTSFNVNNSAGNGHTQKTGNLLISTGKTTDTNVLPPYKAVYIWERTE